MPDSAFGAEALDRARAARWARAFLGTPVLVTRYGITETTVHVTGHIVDPAVQGTASVIGTPIPDAGAGQARGSLGR